MQTFTCKQCIHAGEPHTLCDHNVLECRCQPVSINGFPVVNVESWCSPGRTDTINSKTQSGEELVDGGPDHDDQTQSDDPNDYLTRNNGDGTIITMHIPTIIMGLHDKVKTLELELEILKRIR